MGDADRPISLTIGTAGHVDHGKTTLVRYMTGTDTDRLEEEHRRGISIVAGYAELTLPGGRRASLVDVPGHERFVKNMVAGATGVDAFMLVVAADDGVMPQTREHLDVLRVLGIERGIVALTKTDMVDEEMVELAALDIEELLEATGTKADIFPVSGATGDGVDKLLAALDGLAGGDIHGGGGDGRVARLPVDRAFVLKGIGVVVTGTLWSGEVRVGDVLHTSSGHRPRVRGVQNHGHPAEVAHAGARTAFDLAGIEADEISAGDVLLSRPVPETRMLDVRLRLLETAKPLRHGVLVRLHHGTRDVNARVRLRDLDELSPGGTALARLRLDEPIVAVAGDRFVVRSLAPQITVGGGTVLDPSPSERRPDPAWLEALESGDVSKTAPMALARSPKDGMTTEELSLLLSAPPEEISAALENLPETTKVGGFHALAKETKSAEARLISALEKRAKARPENPGLTVAEARTATGLSPRLADALMRGIPEERASPTESGIVLAGAGEAPPELAAEAKDILEKLREAGHEPPSMESSPAVRLLLKNKEAVALGDGLFAAKEAADRILEEIKAVCRSEGEISLGGLRDRLKTSRKFAQAWLEYADKEGVTARTGDIRILTRRHR
ncbi:MAG: selenocysteine-specific translation elongation factor [Actinomycetota bacterium]|nr:selenocysteine-specific translation elongation factor [Actinomycetota bacterium]